MVRWSRHVSDGLAVGGRETIWVNADETSLAYQFEPRSGTRVTVPPSRSLDEFVERISLAERRQRATLIAAVAGSPSGLPAEPPPQVLLVRRDRAGHFVPLPLPADTPSWIHVWQEDSAWVTTDLWLRWLRLLEVWRAAPAPRAVLVVVVDAFRAHHTPEALMLMERLGMELIVLPAKLTWLLQPLDTHGFALLKSLQHSSLLAARGARDGQLDSTAWWHAMLHAVRGALLGRNWWDVFRSNGLASEARDLREKLRDLGLAAVVENVGALAVEDLQGCLPERSDMNKLRVMWRYALRPRLPGLLALPPPAAPALPPPPVESPLPLGLRLSQRRPRPPPAHSAEHSPSPVARRLP